ncbi:DUF3445 domain-containing protein [uncultured Roseobacter sp.]|uniref:heme-dependent oxidative N-demethylase family protein n=1 Tax=uncultured Roseobacter sp. TaxID=114847 RepID=UPI0026376B58|nr:DUF3445 domain-containing protein [uncultured Roseobacter sp.]
MVEILQKAIPDEMLEPRRLPGVQPLGEPWLRVDDAYAAQMAHRRGLIADRRAEVYWLDGAAEMAAAEVLVEALALLPGLGFAVEGRRCVCPDGVEVDLEAEAPLVVLGKLVQEDICIMEQRGAEHVLVAACLCFPARWLLSEKAGRPLLHIHGAVDHYDEDMARRVQRLFDGVQVGRPLWRFNGLPETEPELFQPRSVLAPPRTRPEGAAPYWRAERQCIVRMPESGAVVFSIHTYVVRGAAG